MKKKIVIAIAIVVVVLLFLPIRLRLKFPEYYNLDTFKGIEVYVWQTEDGEYRCGALYGTNRGKEFDEITNLVKNSATIKEMRTILSSYNIDKESINILPIKINEEDFEIVTTDLSRINEIFWKKYKEGDHTDFSRIEELENWISDEWPLITEFKILHIKVDTINEPQHSKDRVRIKSSYMHNNENVLKTFTFEISYDEFLTLYNNNGHIVYNVEKESGDIVTDIDSESLGILKKAFEQNWRTY